MSLNSYIIDANIEATLKNLTNSDRERKEREPTVTLCLTDSHLEAIIRSPSLLFVCSVPSPWSQKPIKPHLNSPLNQLLNLLLQVNPNSYSPILLHSSKVRTKKPAMSSYDSKCKYFSPMTRRLQ